MRVLTGAQYARMRRKEHPEEARRTKGPVWTPGMLEAGSTEGRDVRDPRPEPRHYR